MRQKHARAALCTGFLAVFSVSSLSALELWMYPEVADKNALFVNAAVLAVSFTPDSPFSVWPPELSADYLLPIGLPLSLGVFMEIPNPNLKHFGGRAAYHFDIHSKKIDLYFMYVFELGWLRNDVLIEYNDTPVEIHYYDFRAGARYIFSRYIGLCIETGHKLENIKIGLSIKIN